MDNKKNPWRKGYDKIAAAWEENPMLVLTVFGIAATGAAKLIDATSAAQSRRAYAKQVDHTVKKNK